MELDKNFLLKAIEEVYKTSVIEKDLEMQNKALSMIDSSVLTEEDKDKIQEDIDYISQKYTEQNFTCYIDGAVEIVDEEANAAIAFVIYLNDEVYYKYKYRIPEETDIGPVSQRTSSHIAEYQALIILLRTLKEQIIYPKRCNILVNTDSEILKGQYYAEYRVSNDVQRELRKEVFELSKNFNNLEINWIPREENIIADRLSKELL